MFLKQKADNKRTEPNLEIKQVLQWYFDMWNGMYEIIFEINIIILAFTEQKSRESSVDWKRHL